jgi:SpoVK/Ycf46/Vps4 family AAA+-type ATPase
MFEVEPATDRERIELWEESLPQALDGDERRELAGQLSWQVSMERSLAESAVEAAWDQSAHQSCGTFAALLWQQVRERTRPRLDGLAQRIDVKATWDDLVLSSDRQGLLRQIRGQVQFRWRVYGEWGLAERHNRGLGISALFEGESGTGKTMAAEVLANDLGLDLYRVDLSNVMNRFLGETEKHLRRLFDAFESCGAILLIDECESLFSKRSEVKDSLDRYSNLEVNYLLQRLESYRGLVILATNHRSVMDTAFLRRLRFVVNFPMPGAEERQRIWRRMLTAPATQSQARIPTAVLDFERLAQFPLSGGSIQNIVLNASFRAASRAGLHRVTMQDVLDAARDEYLKLERPVDNAQFRYRQPMTAETTR